MRVDMVEQLQERIDELEQEAEDRDNEWREASRLMVGGDPGGVEPRHLRKFVGDANETMRKMSCCGTQFGLGQTYLDFLERWPEQ